MKKTLLTVSLLAIAAFAKAGVIAYWDFNDLAITGTVAASNVTVPAATVGSDIASLSLSGWTGGVASFAGTTTNAYNGSASGSSLSLTGDTGTGTAGNGGYIQFTLNLANQSGLSVSFATRGTSTGFNSGQWSYSLDGTTFIDVGSNTASTSTTYSTKTVDLSNITAIDGQSSVYLRYTLSGASSSAGNNRIDNIQFEAVPEPGVAAMMVVGLVAVLWKVRRRAA